MGKNLLVGCSLATVAACIGYWLWSDPPSTPRKQAVSATHSETRKVATKEGCVELYVSGDRTEIIDLATTFEATGDELALQTLLSTTETVEALPPPRLAPVVLIPEVAKPAPSPADQLEEYGKQILAAAVSTCEAIVNQVLPLIGDQGIPLELY